MKALIEKLRSGVDLQSSDIGYAVVLLLSDEVEDEKKVEFLTALQRRAEVDRPLRRAMLINATSPPGF